MNELFVLVLILWVVFFDALRDAWIGKVGWWQWHLTKWAAFFPPLAYISLIAWEWWEVVGVALLSLVVWRAVYETAR